VKHAAVLLTVACLWVSTAGSQAQPCDIYCHSVDRGAAVSTGGAYVLSRTIGQPGAGNLAGGSDDLQGGFWPGIVVYSTGEAPAVFIWWDLVGVTVSWSPIAPGFSHEMSEDVGSGIWDLVPAGDTSPAIVPMDTEAWFFRLVKP